MRIPEIIKQYGYEKMSCVSFCFRKNEHIAFIVLKACQLSNLCCLSLFVVEHKIT